MGLKKEEEREEQFEKEKNYRLSLVCYHSVTLSGLAKPPSQSVGHYSSYLWAALEGFC